MSLPRLPGLLALLLSAGAGLADEAFFERNIRPVLADTCFRCHGGERVGGKLRVDSRAALLKGGESGPAIVPGKPEASLLVRAVRHAEDVSAMPPGKQLPAKVVADLETWVRQGAPWPEAVGKPSAFVHQTHWAFRPVRAVVPPDLPDTPGNAIDRFLAAAQRTRKLHPVGPADRRTLIRRLTFDLTGLPPTPDEVEAFVADARKDAYARLVERLLASPAHGERWGRHWLDVVRYADTAGETADFPLPHAWRYRNYVVGAVNADRPYDAFLREQLAGDLLAARLPADAPTHRHAELTVATGYLAIARRFGFDILHDHYLTIEDTIDVLGKSILGLTVGCARCHDHKYDPVSTTDYYALYGILESTRYPFSGCEKDKRPRDLVSLRTPGAVAYAVAEGRPHDAQLQIRGDPERRGAPVRRGFLQMFGGQTVPEKAGSGRLELAGWLAAPNNPLTARVLVNRVWGWHFGQGLVKTPSDFGTRGLPPSHPELLDYLAARFVADGWSIKALHRLIVYSAAYQRASAVDERNVTTDPDNTYLWRFSRRRLSGEEIRDAMLAVSGDLDRRPGGPHPFPPEGSWGFTQHGPFAAVYDHDRRSVYLMVQRIKRHPFLGLFDGADASSSTPVRHTTTVPTQALFFLNDPFVHARAARLAGALSALVDDPARVDRACRLLFGRPATTADVTAAARFLATYAADVADRTECRRQAWAAYTRVLLASNEFLHVD